MLKISLYLLRRHSVYHCTHICPLVAAHSAIGIEEVRFTSGVWIDDNGTFHLAEHPGLPTYVGPPNSKIDKAWDDIVERKLQ